MIAGFLRQTCTWERRNGEDAWNHPAYDDPEEISCRWVRKSRVIKGLMGEDVQTSAEVMAQKPVEEHDRLAFEGKSFLVVSVATTFVDAGGNVLGRKVLVK